MKKLLFLFLVLYSSIGSALDRRILLNNYSNYVVTEVYATNAGTTNWGYDILGKDILRPGDSEYINFIENTRYCVFDFKIIALDAEPIIRYGVNVCQITNYDLY